MRAAHSGGLQFLGQNPAAGVLRLCAVQGNAEQEAACLTKYSAVWLYPLSCACFLLIPLGLSRVMLKIPGLRKLVT